MYYSYFEQVEIETAVFTELNHKLPLLKKIKLKKKISRMNWKVFRYDFKEPQLPGRLFSPSDICKRLSHHFLLHSSIGMGSYDHHPKYQGVFQDLL